MLNESDGLVPMNYFLEPGHIFLPTRPTVISVVVGSSVAVSVYDRKRLVGGMSHFQAPCVHDKYRATARYGNVATLTLVQMMIDDGSKVKHLEAQVFGGAHNRKVCTRNVGRANVIIARRILASRRIPIISEDVGGQKGRKVVFNARTNEIAVLKVDRLRKSDWYPYEIDR